MQDKQKVTLYLPPNLHRRLKVQAALEVESMSAMVEKAIAFYLQNPEVVEDVEASQGKTHRVYSCPECHSPLVKRDGEMVALDQPPAVLAEEMPKEIGQDINPEIEIPVEQVREVVGSRSDSHGEETLVPC
ncbi:CopG family transcriptional regulator [Spirulina subsalsa]|uniref:ribbon-helix-helix domain-containing protein n=1 Tax=Spirulina subsalsa TaxID=54311 RepID=UPI000317EF31|nr:CopG family transcriptional regulator [Spirulina subsalsa]